MTPCRITSSSITTLIAAYLGLFVGLVDANAVNLALPAIRADLGGGISGAQWTIDAYNVAFAAVLLTAGSLGDRFGRRALLRFGLTTFVVASLACGAHVLFECVEVPNRRRLGNRREHLDGVELEHVMRISAQFIALRGEQIAIVTEEAQQRGPGIARVDPPVDQQPGALGRVLRLGERHPAHRSRRLRMSKVSAASAAAWWVGAQRARRGVGIGAAGAA